MNETDFNTFKDSPNPANFSDTEIEESLLFKTMLKFLTAASLLVPALAAKSAFKAILRIPAAGPLPSMSSIFSVLERGGLYTGNEFHRWINEKILTRLRQSPSPGGAPSPLSPQPTFQELVSRTGIRLHVVASDIGRQRMLVFNAHCTPQLPVATAVRMSMSIPFFFVPVPYLGCPIVDGGILSNYPMYLLKRQNPYSPNTPDDIKRPNIGFLLDDGPDPAQTPSQICPPGPPQGCPSARVTFFEELMKSYETVTGAFDRRETGDFRKNTVRIDVSGYSTFNFDVNKSQKRDLANRGWQATAQYFKTQGIVPTPPPSPYLPEGKGSMAPQRR